MTYPSRPSRGYSYTGFSQAQGDNSFPGPYVDVDFDVLNTAVNQTIDFLQGAFRPDGVLGNGSVPRSALAADIVLGLPRPRAWAAATQYEVDDTVTNDSILYVALRRHISTSAFADDLAAGEWQALADLGTGTTPGDGTVTTPKLAGLAVTNPKLANAAVDGRVLAPSSISQSHLNKLGTVPIGAEVDFAGIYAPPGWLLEHGQLINRVTYNDLLLALSVAGNGVKTLGSPVLTNVNVSLIGLGLFGAYIEGAGIPFATTVVSVTATTITMSAPVTTSGAGGFRVYPHGNGDGATTFNLPDFRDYVPVGRGDMGGVGTGRITVFRSDSIGRTYGFQQHALTVDEMPNHDHGGVTGIQSAAHAHPMNLSEQTFQTTAGAPNGLGLGGSTGTTGAENANHNHLIVSAGASGAHNNIQPSRTTNRIIFTGVFS